MRDYRHYIREYEIWLNQIAARLDDAIVVGQRLVVGKFSVVVHRRNDRFDLYLDGKHTVTRWGVGALRDDPEFVAARIREEIAARS